MKILGLFFTLLCLTSLGSCLCNSESSSPVPLDSSKPNFPDTSKIITKTPFYELLPQEDFATRKNPPRKEALLQKADNYFFNKNYNKAVFFHKKLISENHLSSEDLLRLAEKYTLVKHSFCLFLCNQLIKADKKRIDPKPYFLKAIYYESQNKDSTAIHFLDKAIKTSWSFIEAWIQKGVIYFSNQNFEQAYKIFIKAKSLNHKSADIYYWLGRCEEKLNKQDKALRNYYRAIFFDKNLKDAHLRLRNLEDKQTKP